MVCLRGLAPSHSPSNFLSSDSSHRSLCRAEKVPEDSNDKELIQRRLEKRFPLDAFRLARKKLDPNGILSNPLLDELIFNKETKDRSEIVQKK